MPRQPCPEIYALNGRTIREDIVLGPRIGQGGFGVVHVGRHPDGTTVSCAVKVIPANARTGLLAREIEHHTRVSDLKSVVTLHGVIRDKSFVYLVMDYCPGGTLNERVTKLMEGPYPSYGRNTTAGQSTRIGWLIQIVDAIAQCHRRSIYHRDIKPENILFDETRERLFLADFGLSRNSPYSNDVRSGTLEYSSPECLAESVPPGMRVPLDNGPVDAWAFGVLLHVVMFMEKPWDMASLRDPRFKEFVNNPRYYFIQKRNISIKANKLLYKLFDLNPTRRIGFQDIKHYLTSMANSFFALPGDPPVRSQRQSIGPRLIEGPPVPQGQRPPIPPPKPILLTPPALLPSVPELVVEISHQSPFLNPDNAPLRLRCREIPMVPSSLESALLLTPSNGRRKKGGAANVAIVSPGNGVEGLAAEMNALDIMLYEVGQSDICPPPPVVTRRPADKASADPSRRKGFEIFRSLLPKKTVGTSSH